MAEIWLTGEHLALTWKTRRAFSGFTVGCDLLNLRSNPWEDLDYDPALG